MRNDRPSARSTSAGRLKALRKRTIVSSSGLRTQSPLTYRDCRIDTRQQMANKPRERTKPTVVARRGRSRAAVLRTRPTKRCDPQGTWEEPSTERSVLVIALGITCGSDRETGKKRKGGNFLPPVAGRPPAASRRARGGSRPQANAERTATSCQPAVQSPPLTLRCTTSGLMNRVCGSVCEDLAGAHAQSPTILLVSRHPANLGSRRCNAGKCKRP